jgi:hypothetical protein
MQVFACVRVEDGKSLGYYRVDFEPKVRHTFDAGLLSCDGINVTKPSQSLEFAKKAKVFKFRRQVNDQNAPF